MRQRFILVEKRHRVVQHLLREGTLGGGSELAAGGLSITPLALGIVVLVVEVSLSEGHDIGEILLVLGLDIGDAQAGGGLLADNGTEASLALHNAVWHVTGLAQGWEPDHELDRIDIVSDDDKLGLLLLDEGGDMVDTHLHGQRLLVGGVLVTCGNLRGLGGETLLLGSLGLRLEVVQQTEQGGRLTLVEGQGELVDRWRDLDALQECHLSPLEADVLWPLHETGEVTLVVHDVTTNAELARFLLDGILWEFNLRGGTLGHLLHHCRWRAMLPM